MSQRQTHVFKEFEHFLPMCSSEEVGMEGRE